MSDVTIEIRQPFPPHALLTLVRYSALSYGFLLGGVGSASFSVSRADQALLDTPGFFQEGKVVTIRREDGALPWAGYVTGTRVSLDDPTVQFECQEASGALFEHAHTSQQWAERQLSASQWLRWAFADTSGRGAPPLLVRLGPGGGPVVRTSPQANSFRAFLDTIAESADWEWGLHHRLSRQSVVTELVFRQRVGRDYSSELIFEEGVHFTGAELVRDTAGFIHSSLAVGGSGAFNQRSSVQVVQAGSSESGVTAQRQAVDQVPTSPAKAGSVVSIEPSVTNESALRASAQRQFRASPGERLSLSLYEAALNMHQLTLGGVYRVRFDDLNLGRPLERKVRVLGIRLGVDGVVEPVVEVQGA